MVRSASSVLFLLGFSFVLFGCGGASSNSTPVPAPPVVNTANEWTWESGTSDPPAGIGQSGVYGTIGVAAATNVPGARGSGAGWADASGNLWLYGGYGLDSRAIAPGALGDVWKYDIASSQWIWMAGADSINAPASYGMLGVASATNVPGARSNFEHWVDKSGNLWVFGGAGIVEGGGEGGLGDLWEFVPGTTKWTWVAGSGGPFPASQYGTLGVAAPGNIPGFREGGITWTDAAGKLWLFGGYGETAPGGPDTEDVLNDLWVFDPATTLWTWRGGTGNGNVAGVYGTLGTASSANLPGGRSGAQGWTDASGNTWLFGGFGYDAQGNRSGLNDLWELNPISLEWTWVSGSNTVDAAGNYGTQGTASATSVPGARSEAVTWTDNTGKLWLMGGQRYDASGAVGDLGDLWSFDPATKLWTWAGGSTSVNGAGVYGTLGTPSAANGPAARTDAVSMTDSTGNLWLFGGYAANSAGPDNIALNDLWKYQP